MRLTIHSIAVDSEPYGQKWTPPDPSAVVVSVLLGVGPKGKKSADNFSILVVTPSGLVELEDNDGVILHRRVIVLREYDFLVLRKWLESVVRACEAETWEACVEKLRRRFDWEFENYVEH